MGKRGPAKTPTNILKARDSGLVTQRGDEPQPPTGDVDCPGWVDPLAVAYWDYYYPICKDMNVLTLADMPAFQLMCVHLSNAQRFQERLYECLDPEKGGSPGADVTKTGSGYRAPNPLIAMIRNESGMALKYMARFGLTPADRANVRVSETGGKDKSKGRFFDNGGRN